MLWAAPVRAQVPSDGITVRGVGTALGHPIEADIVAVVSGEGELAADAEVKYQDTKKRALAALTGLGIPDLTVEPQGPAIQQSMGDINQQIRIMNGMAPPAAKPKVQVNEDLLIRIKGADKQDPETLVQTVLKVIDAGRDAGLQIGPAGPSSSIQVQIRGALPEDLVRFVIPDSTDVENQAYQSAMDDARAKAQRLAKLSGVQLGAVASVEDQGVTPPTSGASANESVIAAIYGVSAPSSPDKGKMISAATLGGIPVTVHVTMKFAVSK